VALVSSKSPLNDVLLCTSREGTIALISLREMDLFVFPQTKVPRADDRLYIIPASRAPVRRVFFDNKDILLAYANGKARVWNHQTCEFRRSTGLDAAEDMLSDGAWEEV
jgi:hypothetical protein